MRIPFVVIPRTVDANQLPPGGRNRLAALLGASVET